MISRLQFLLRWVFMRVEALFNTAFGDRLNPLYHLGAITFMLFWLVAGSGLYLYAFFETGVAGAYASVDVADAPPVVRRRHHAQRASVRLRCDGADDAAAHAAPLCVRSHARLPLVLVGQWRGPDLGRLRVRRQRLHAAVGPVGAVRHRRVLRVARLAAWLRWHADSQLHLPVQRQRPILLVAVFHAHRHTAGRAASDVDTCATRAEGKDQPAATAHGERGADAGSAVTGQAGAEPGWRGQPRRLPGQPATRLVLPCNLPAPLPVAAGAGLGLAGCGHRGGSWRCRGCRRASSGARRANSA